MDNERTEQPYGDLGPGGGSLGPHLADYWQIVYRRIWLVLLIFAVTTASAMWAVSRQRTQYRADLTLQVNDPLQTARALNPTARISSMEIFVDPIESEIQVLQSANIAREVVDSLGMRLAPVSEDLVRSDLFREARVDPDAEPGTYELAFGENGETVTLRGGDGGVLATGAPGQRLDAGFVSFIPESPPLEARVYPVEILPTGQAVSAVRGRISASPRQSTNLIDVSYISHDPALAPHVLTHAAEALRRYGAERVSVAADKEVSFIEQEMDEARAQLQRSLERIQDFKESRAFTDLSLREQALVNESEEMTARIQALDEHRAFLSDLVREVERVGVSEMDLVQVKASLPEAVNPQIGDLVDRIRDRQSDLRSVLTEERVTTDHPRAQALVDRIRSAEEDLLAALQANLRTVENRLERLREQQMELRDRQRAFPELENQLQTLQLQQEMDQGTYQYLVSQLYQARIMEAAASPYVDILDRPIGATEIDPRGRMNILLGALLGLLLGTGAAFFLEYLDRTVRTTADVEAFLGIPALGIIPRLRKVEEAEGKEKRTPAPTPLVVALDPVNPAAEAYRNLRMNVMFMSTEDDPIRSLVFTSPGPSEGKSTTALNFAVILAQQGERVILVDADLRRPALHRSMDVLREPGLTNVLVGDASLKEALRPNVLPNLDFLPAGPFPPNPSELLNSRSMERLLEELEGEFAHVVLDSPPVLAVTDASILGARMDGVVVVLRSGKTEQKAAERSVDQLRRIGIRVFGAVLNEVTAATPEESYYLQYYYSYRPDGKEAGGLSKVRQTLSRARFWVG